MIQAPNYYLIIFSKENVGNCSMDEAVKKTFGFFAIKFGIFFDEKKSWLDDKKGMRGSLRVHLWPQDH